MYATIHRRKDNPEHLDRVGQRANDDYFPKLRQAPGLVAMYLIKEEDNGMRTALTVWESHAHAAAFQGEEGRLDQLLDEHQQALQYRSQGEVVAHVHPSKSA